MKRALVTGGAGFIGSNLTIELVKRGWTVDIVDDMTNGHLELLDSVKTIVFLPGLLSIYESQHPRDTGIVYVHECDFAHPAILERIRNRSYDVVFHQAAVPRVSYSIEAPVHTTDINLFRSIKLLHECVGNVKKVVVASSSSVYGGADEMPTVETNSRSPKSPYAMQKSAFEDFCRLFGSLYGLDTVCLRYFNVFGPGQYGDSPYSTAISAWCDALSSGKLLRSDGDGSQSRDMCYIDNIVSANILAAEVEKPLMGNAYNICCGDKTENRQILAEIMKRFPDTKVINAPWRAGDIMHTQGSWYAANRDFGYQPLVRFWDGFEKTLAWWKLV